MSEVKVNKISPRTNCGTVTLGDSGDSFVIPAGATITNNGTQTGFGRTGTVDWDTTAKTASFTAVSGNGYFVNTTSGAITVTLPAGSAGDIVGISDYASTFQTNNVTITPNGTDKINGVNGDSTLSTQGLAVSLVYVDSTRGWKSVTGSDNDTTGQSFITATGGTITTCGNFKIHTFTGPGTFCVSGISQTPANNTVGYMVVAGGGGGGGCAGGGGGAGGFREGRNVPVDNFTASPLVADAPTNAITVTATGYPITVGGGGVGQPTPGVQATAGSPSIFSTITSAGGGFGGGRASAPSNCGGNGGSGGGNSADAPTNRPSGNSPPVSPPQGQGGGIRNNPVYNSGGNGGGGATQQGADDANPEPAAAGAPDGGDGAQTSISGSATYYAGGGGGGGYGPHPAEGGCGGAGGGGRGARDELPGPAAFAVTGTANTGGGGGAGNNNLPLNPGKGAGGGSGIVIIRYKYQ